MPASFRPTRFEGQFQRPELTGGPGSNAGAAAGNVNLGNTFGSLRKNGPRFDELAATAVANRVEGQIAATGVQAYGQVKADDIISEAKVKAAQDAARGSMMGSAFGAVGSIGSLLLSGGIA